MKKFQQAGQPVISVDTKKKELVGDFANKGREYQPQGQPEEVGIHDFPDPVLGKVSPYGKDVVHSFLRRAGAPRRHPSDSCSGGLTSRQREVLQLVAEGYSNRDAAGILNISIKTVEFHKSRIIKRLGVRATAELTRYAIARRLESR